MAPLTRMRAANPGHVPSQLHVEYYAQRASAGLIIGECTEISPDAYGWADTPGLWSAEQVRGANWPTVYASGPNGYTDYPPLIESLSHQEWGYKNLRSVPQEGDTEEPSIAAMQEPDSDS